MLNACQLVVCAGIELFDVVCCALFKKGHAVFCGGWIYLGGINI